MMLAMLVLLVGDPDLAALERFPTLATANAHIGALIRIRYALKQAAPSKERNEAIRFDKPAS